MRLKLACRPRGKARTSSNSGLRALSTLAQVNGNPVCAHSCIPAPPFKFCLLHHGPELTASPKISIFHLPLLSFPRVKPQSQVKKKRGERPLNGWSGMGSPEDSPTRKTRPKCPHSNLKSFQVSIESGHGHHQPTMLCGRQPLCGARRATPQEGGLRWTLFLSLPSSMAFSEPLSLCQPFP